MIPNGVSYGYGRLYGAATLSVGHNLQHLGAQAGEGRMKRSRPGGEIGQREI
jgi:hypothetical protein